jgi:hypothetical protein
MDETFPAGETNDVFSLERCRELLADEAIDLTDDKIDRIRRCADTVAHAMTPEQYQPPNVCAHSLI